MNDPAGAQKSAGSVIVCTMPEEPVPTIGWTVGVPNVRVVSGIPQSPGCVATSETRTCAVQAPSQRTRKETDVIWRLCPAQFGQPTTRHAIAENASGVVHPSEVEPSEP